MNQKILSISIAAYNMEAFLKRCIDSIIDQEYISDIDIIIVNDGSTDNTLDIAREYQKEFPNSIRVIDKKNGGYGSATNVAIHEAIGKYFKVLDADDWLEKASLNYFIKYLKKVDVDLIITHYSQENAASNNSFPIIYKGIEFERIYDFTNFCISDTIGKLGFEMHAMSYKTELLQKNKIHVSECYYSDVDYSVYPLVHVKTISFVDKILYRYFIGRNGQSVSGIGLVKHFEDHLYVCRKLIDYYTDHHAMHDDAISLNIGYNAANIVLHIIDVLYNSYYDYNKDIAKCYVNNLMIYLQNKDCDLFEVADNRKKHYELRKSIR
jgi:glycosyltransferase involved in cell wall biosynthesis